MPGSQLKENIFYMFRLGTHKQTNKQRHTHAKIGVNRFKLTTSRLRTGFTAVMKIFQQNNNNSNELSNVSIYQVNAQSDWLLINNQMAFLSLPDSWRRAKPRVNYQKSIETEGDPSNCFSVTQTLIYSIKTYFQFWFLWLRQFYLRAVVVM